MERVSSNSSLFLKIFIPTFWLVFFGLFTLMTVITENENPVFNTIEYKISIIILYLIGALVMYWSFIKLKRVEMGPEAFSVSNYFKTYQYSYGSIDFFRENNYFIFRTVNIGFKQKTTFGKKVSFISDKQRLEGFFKNNPEVFEFLKEKIVE